MKKAYQKLSWRAYQHLVNLKRRLLNWRGDGVHSPYAFRLIRQVIRNPHTYEAYRNLYDKARARQYRSCWAESCIVDKSRLELIFRLVLSHQPDRYYIHSAGRVEANDLLRDYVCATGYRQSAERREEAELLIVEDMAEGECLKTFLPPKGRAKYMLLLNTHNPRVRASLQGIKVERYAPISFKLIGLEIWVWRPNTTPGRYPVYYK